MLVSTSEQNKAEFRISANEVLKVALVVVGVYILANAIPQGIHLFSEWAAKGRAFEVQFGEKFAIEAVVWLAKSAIGLYLILGSNKLAAMINIQDTDKEHI